MKRSARLTIAVTFLFGVIGVLIALGIASRMPPRFLSTGTVVLFENKAIIPATLHLALNGPALAKLVERLNLYPAERKTGSLERVLENMRRAVSFKIDEDNVHVSFIHADPKTAQIVTQDLIAHIIAQDRTHISEVERRVSPGILQIVSPAKLPRVPETSQKTRLTAFGLIGGIVLGFAFSMSRVVHAAIP